MADAKENVGKHRTFWTIVGDIVLGPLVALGLTKIGDELKHRHDLRQEKEQTSLKFDEVMNMLNAGDKDDQAVYDTIVDFLHHPDGLQTIRERQDFERNVVLHGGKENPVPTMMTLRRLVNKFANHAERRQYALTESWIGKKDNMDKTLAAAGYVGNSIVTGAGKAKKATKFVGKQASKGLDGIETSLVNPATGGRRADEFKNKWQAELAERRK